MCPWTPSDVARHNKRAAKNHKRERQWTDVANAVLAKTGNEVQAIREANGAVDRSMTPAGRRRNPRT